MVHFEYYYSSCTNMALSLFLQVSVCASHQLVPPSVYIASGSDGPVCSGVGIRHLVYFTKLSNILQSC